MVVANYEQLAPYEASYGLENNILNDLYTSFIPRFIWNEKPPTSDARAYSDLYFNFGENSFAISPFGDLIRNFGPIGIPLGIYCRASLAELMDAERLFTETKQGFDFYHRTFGVRYPFGKYDQLFVPEFNAGAMENAGAVTFLEDYVFRSKVSR